MSQTAVIYARYSSHQQRDVSIEQQVNACQKYAQENALQILRVYDDHAMTGTNDNRPAFQQMIRDSASRAFQYVIVYSLDRFSRDRYDSAVHKHTLKEHGVRVLSAMENIQDNPTGVLMESILEGFAEYYSKELAQKTMRGIRSNAEKCLATGQPAYGYRINEQNRYEIIPAEAAVVREIFERVASHVPFKTIIDDLNARAIPTKHGGRWNKNSFSRILSNERYIGVFIYSDIRVEGGMPAIIDKALFDRVQDRCRNKPNARSAVKRRREHGAYILTGKLFCGHCGQPMVGVSGTGKHGELHFYYACKGKLARKCKKKNVPRERIETLIAQKIFELISDDENCNVIADMLLEYLHNAEESDEIKNLKAQIAALEKEQENTLKAIRMGITSKSVQTMLEQIESSLDSLRARLAIATERSRVNITKEEILALFDIFRDGDLTSNDFRERLIDAFLVRAYLYDDRVKILFNYSATPEIEIPFNPSDPTPSGVRITPPMSHLCSLIRTQDVVYFVKGVFVIEVCI